MGKIVKYKMELEVLTPVHIGGVDYKTKLDKKEYLFNPNTKDLTILDNNKFVNFLIKRNLFDKYVSDIQGNVNNKKYSQNRSINLFNFLKDNNIYNNLKEFTKKEYRNLDIDTENGRMNTVKLLNKDIYGEVYIPGSSIKGALVNLLLVNYIINNQEEFETIKEEVLSKIKKASEKNLYELKKEIKSKIKDIENKLLYDDSKNSKKIGISVSDTYVSHDININFYQDIDEKIKDGKPSFLPIVREYIEPKSVFEFDITLDFELLEKSKLNIKKYDDLIEALENATEYLIENTLNLSNDLCAQNLILGANTGFHQKTIIHALFKDKNERLEVTKKILHKSSKNVITNHLNDKYSPRVINRIKKNGELKLAGLVEIRKIGEKNVGSN